MPAGPLQAALPREMYVDPATWLTERDLALYGQWFCLGRTDDLGLGDPSRVVDHHPDDVRSDDLLAGFPAAFAHPPMVRPSALTIHGVTPPWENNTC